MEKVLKIIKKYNINSYKDLLSLENRLAFFLNEISSAFTSIPEKIQANPNNLNFKIKLNKHTTKSVTKRNLNNIAKKSLVYSSKSIIEIPEVYFDVNKGAGIDYLRLMKNKEYRIKKAKQFHNTFVEPYLKLEEAITNNLIEVYPKSIDVCNIKPNFFNKAISHNNEYKYTPPKSKEKAYKKFRIKETISEDFVDLFTNRADLLMQLTEDNACINNPCDVKLFLPHIDGIDIKTWSKIKLDYHDRFERFHQKTSLLFNKSSALTSEDKLLELMSEVDYEVRKLKDFFSQLEKDRKLRNFTIGSGITVLTLGIVLQDEMVKSIIPAIGTAIFGGVWSVSVKRTNIKRMTNEDFFVPWYLDKLYS